MNQDINDFLNLSDSDDDVQTEPPPQDKLMQIQQYVKQWLSIDDEVKKLKKAIQVRKQQQKQITETILGFMDNYNIPHFNTHNGKLIFAKSQQTESVNQKFLQSALDHLFPQQSEQIMGSILNLRQKKERVRLKRTSKHS
tara:strand:+ start:682 stop:1101 length:420 start_codon:yes stop_codon:yes gene_type:complete